MSAAPARIVELCASLAEIAGRLDEPRSAAPLLETSEPLYRELEALMQGASVELVDLVLADPRVAAALPDLHRLRAAYEFDKEARLARRILDSGDPGEGLAAVMAEEAHWALAPELRAALAGRRRILVAGSGPLPLTALAIVQQLGMQVTALERDAAAHALGRRVVEVSGVGGAVRAVQADIAAFSGLADHDAVVGAVLLGVGSDRSDPAKGAVLRRVAGRLRPGAGLVLREPHGLGRLLYPPADLEGCPGLDLAYHPPEAGPGVPYRSGLIVAHRRKTEDSDARPGALQLHS